MLAKAREATVSQGKEGDVVEVGDEEVDIRINRSNNKSKKDNPIIGSWAFYWDEQAIREGFRRNRWIRGIMNGYRWLRVVGR